jgi:Fur family transcriptional regulator, peroxide stress response regulator
MRTVPLDHESLRLVLEGAGLRSTPQRLAVYDHLTRAAHHPTAEEVYHAVRSAIPKISLATVYKALETLVATGVAAKLTAGAGTGDTSARYDARRDLHYHFRCLRTGSVHDLPTPFDPELIGKLDPQLSDYLSRQGFQVTGYRLELVGYLGGVGCGEEESRRDPSSESRRATEDREGEGDIATPNPESPTPNPDER